MIAACAFKFQSGQIGFERLQDPRCTARVFSPILTSETSMGTNLDSEQFIGHCPRCDSEAHYRFGKTVAGKQRFLCLTCGRQFTDIPRVEIRKRPECQVCGRKMHVYRKDKELVRFRCSGYPFCKSFLKISKKEYELLFVPFRDEIGNQEGNSDRRFLRTSQTQSQTKNMDESS